MKKVFKLSGPPITRYSLLNETSDDQYNQSAKSDTIESYKKLDILENSQNIQQYKVITVPVHNIKILNVKKSVPCQQYIKTSTVSNSSGTNLMYKLPSRNNSSIADNEVSKVIPELISISADKTAKNFSNNEICSQFEDDSGTQLISPSSRWLSQPRSYRGAKKDYSQRKIVRKISVSSFVDTTDGETSGMGSSVDEPVESSTESASEASSSFLQPRQSSRPLSISPSAVKKRRGGWPKGRKRKPEPPGTKTPKAPQTAYVLFLNERRKFYKETHPNLPFVEVTKLLGAEWSSMTQAQKAVYMTRSEQDKKRYRNELQTFRQSPDYQILLRKKRIKNAINRGQTTEESSDFTDEVDDDDSEELHCRTCDQWFSSIHNKREHLYGKPHLQAITGGYQREREAEMRRRMVSPAFENLHATKLEDQKTIPEIHINNGEDKINKPLILDGCSSRRDSIGVASTTEDDRDDDDDDDDGDVDDEEEEDSEYDGEGEVTEEEGGSEGSKEACGSCNFFSERVTDAAEGVISKVLNREMEIRFLRNRYEKSRRNQRQIYTTLATLQTKQKLLHEQQQRLIQEEKTLMEQAQSLAKISELCKSGIQLRNSERESDKIASRQIGQYSSDVPPHQKLSGNSSDFLSPDTNSSFDSQEIGNSSLFLCSSSNDKVLVLSNQAVSDPVDYNRLSVDLTSSANLDGEDIKKEKSVAEASVAAIERKPVYELYEYQNAFNPQTDNNDSMTSKIKIHIGEPIFDQLERYSTVLPKSSTKREIDHSYSKLDHNSTTLCKKKPTDCKNSSNTMVVDLHPDMFRGTKFKRNGNKLLNPIDNFVDTIEVPEPSSIHEHLDINSIYNQNEYVGLSMSNSSLSQFSQNLTETVAKLSVTETLTTKSCVKDTQTTKSCVRGTRTTKFVDPFHSIKEKPPNIGQKSTDNANHIVHINFDELSSNDAGNSDNEFLLEESSDLDHYINNFIQEEIGYTDSVSKLLTMSETDIMWQDVSKAQKFRYHNLNILPSLDNIFEEDDAVGNLSSDTS